MQSIFELQVFRYHRIPNNQHGIHTLPIQIKKIYDDSGHLELCY